MLSNGKTPGGDPRARLEQEMLSHYFDQLRECGIKGYSWEALWCDDHISVVRSLLIPAWQWAHLERGLLADEDLDCTIYF